MNQSRAPIALLRPFVESLCVFHGDCADVQARERVLPSAAMHLAIRLDGKPVRVFDDGASNGRDIGHSVIGGARAAFYTKAVGGVRCTVGAQLRPGAARAFFGIGADALAHRHVSLDQIWGVAAHHLRERLQASPDVAGRLDLLEAFLTARLVQDTALHPGVACALRDFSTGSSVRAAVAASGYSHRRFIALFEDAVGLTPKRYCRVLRFQSMLARGNASTLSWTHLALDAGYTDQSHFMREFRAFAGMTPAAYRRQPHFDRNHVAVSVR